MYRKGNSFFKMAYGTDGQQSNDIYFGQLEWLSFLNYIS
ncbi:hypothetical protein SAMN05421740_104145 [Parapedobacter koreensis]|uniref:Uncharacterized protein n=1 Tax=Parapedobacter koreensis TaxID=332977 RepID=A0A1H7NZU3_9SPHI|nr:hypothetical protein SAMN05421740_104145 [Parapedobacter koreensis]